MQAKAEKSKVDQPKVVSHAEWMETRKEFLTNEKEFTRLRDELSRQRRELPWIKVEKNYVFDTPSGKQTLSDLFQGRSQLVVYLNHRDVSLVAVSKAPLKKLEAFRQRMGWTFKWVSSFGNEFNNDFHVSFTPEEMSKGATYYNYEVRKFPSEEAPGISVFCKNAKGEVFHTYSCYARGLDMMNVAYHYLDLVPKGRDEEQLPFSMAWVRYHDKYED